MNCISRSVPQPLFHGLRYYIGAFVVLCGLILSPALLRADTLTTLRVQPVDTTFLFAAWNDVVPFQATGTWTRDDTSTYDTDLTSSVTWSVDQPLVASIGSEGKAACGGLSVGPFNVIARYGDVQGQYNVQTVPVLNTSAPLGLYCSATYAYDSNTNAPLLSTQIVGMKFTIWPACIDGAEANLSLVTSWSSDNTGVATVDSQGKVTAVGAGSCNITATAGYNGTTLSNSVAVNVGKWQLQDINYTNVAGNYPTPFVPMSLNNAGQVLGQAGAYGFFDSNHAFLLDNGALVDLGAFDNSNNGLNISQSNPMALNDFGQAVGNSHVNYYGPVAALFGAGGATQIGSFYDSVAYSINNNGDILLVNNDYDQTPTVTTNYLLPGSGGRINLGNTFGPTKINNNGRIIGQQITFGASTVAGWWDSGTWNTLPLQLQSGTNTLALTGHSAYDINDNGIIVGLATLTGGTTTGYFWVPTEDPAQPGQLFDLAASVGGQAATLSCVNNLDMALGYQGNTPTLFLLDTANGSNTTTINIPAAIANLNPSWDGVGFMDVNDGLTLLGYGTGLDSSGRRIYSYFLLIPPSF